MPIWIAPVIAMFVPIRILIITILSMMPRWPGLALAPIRLAEHNK